MDVFLKLFLYGDGNAMFLESRLSPGNRSTKTLGEKDTEAEDSSDCERYSESQTVTVRSCEGWAQISDSGKCELKLPVRTYTSQNVNSFSLFHN